MAWARTMMSLFVVSAIFLRWLPRHGWPVAILVAVAGATALAIYISQRRRYHHQATGIRTSRLRADVTATLLTSTAVSDSGHSECWSAGKRANPGYERQLRKDVPAQVPPIPPTTATPAVPDSGWTEWTSSPLCPLPWSVLTFGLLQTSLTQQEIEKKA
ncbi:DUF202 domain-containing protein [Paenarthrobacter sp. NEAU-H11]|uniref:DUF202 domain-containing protein n=1 Tax=Paenarthrobacter sp. NEAU-H11 TaxID=3423924 RepID=UPI003D32C982